MEPTTEEKYAYAQKKFKRIELLYNLTIGLPLVVFGIFFLTTITMKCSVTNRLIAFRVGSP